jgi:hypothetical protein
MMTNKHDFVDDKIKGIVTMFDKKRNYTQNFNRVQ